MVRSKAYEESAKLEGIKKDVEWKMNEAVQEKESA
jgi:hypothetical protein